MAEPSPPPSRSRTIAFAVLAAAGCLGDLGTKRWIFERLGYDPSAGRIVIAPDLLALETHLNEGALFGMGQGQTLVFAGLSFVAITGILYWLFWGRAARDLLLTVALGLVTGGILGNLYDRLGLPGLVWRHDGPLHRAGEPVYAVRDWIHFHWVGVLDWPVFNLADSLLVCGAGLLLWHAVRGQRRAAARPNEPVGASQA